MTMFWLSRVVVIFKLKISIFTIRPNWLIPQLFTLISNIQKVYQIISNFSKIVMEQILILWSFWQKLLAQITDQFKSL